MLLGPITSAPVMLVAGVMYPAYSTFKALKSAAAPDMTRWLQYWMIFALLMAVLPVVEFVGAFLPLYYEAKVGFMLWLMTDRFKGATVLCTKYLEPLLTQHEGTIDKQLAVVYAKLRDFKVEDVSKAVEWATEQANSVSGKKAAAPKPAPKAAPAEQAEKPAEPEDEAPVDVSAEAKKVD